MIAAANDRNDTLDLLKLILTLVHQRSTVPAELQGHFVSVIAQAKELAKHPEGASAEISPEAVRLAYQLQSWKDLAEAFDAISDFRSIRPDIAARLLERMERRSAG